MIEEFRIAGTAEGADIGFAPALPNRCGATAIGKTMSLPLVWII
jgi:hypothetical protein